MALWKTTFVSEHLHSLYALSVAVLTIPANSSARVNHAKSAKHAVDCHVFFPTRTHLHYRKCDKVFVSSLFEYKV